MIFEGKWTDLISKALRYRLDAEPWDSVVSLIANLPAWTLAPDKILSAAPGNDIADVVATLVKANIRIRAVEPLKQNLEEIYLNLVSTPASPSPT